MSAAKTVILSSANSINIGRLVPQIVYYFYSYYELVRKDETIKSMLVDEASKDYLVLKEQVLVESSNILKLLENNKYDKKELLAYLNQLEKIGNELSLRGYLVYKEIDGE